MNSETTINLEDFLGVSSNTPNQMCPLENLQTFVSNGQTIRASNGQKGQTNAKIFKDAAVQTDGLDPRSIQIECSSSVITIKLN